MNKSMLPEADYDSSCNANRKKKNICAGEFKREDWHYISFYTTELFCIVNITIISLIVWLFSAKPGLCYFNERQKH